MPTKVAFMETRVTRGGGEVTPFAPSTTLITGMTTICSMTPTAASMALSNAANGPIQDTIGMNGAALNHLKEAARLVSHIQRASDAADPNLTLLNGVYNSLIGSGSPTTNNVIQSMDTIIAAGPTALTAVKCSGANGPIIDYTGNCVGVNVMFKETRNILVLVYRDLDPADPMRALLGDILLTLASPQTLLLFLEWLEGNQPLPDVPPVTIDPTSGTIPKAGGSGTITVTVTGEGVTNTWTVDKDGDALWLHLVSPPLHEPQTAVDGTVNYTVDSNLGSVARVGHFYINGKTYTVNQLGA